MNPPAALFASRDDRGRLRCGLCPRGCVFGNEGDTGFCGTRRLEDGELRAASYGMLVSAQNDPIEKKPLFHYKPGSASFSIAAAGCNLSCPFCQNASISQEPRPELRDGRVPGRFTPAREVVEAAKRLGSASISVTYTEPILLLEYARDLAAEARPEGIGVVFVTNGAWSAEAARTAAGILDAANVDLKCFSERKYADVLGAPLASVQTTIEALAAAGVWVEVTTLLVPGFSDDEDELQAAARWLTSISRDMPWHVTRFHPDFRWTDRPATPVSLLVRAREIGLAAGLRHVYTGNVAGDEGENTYCPSCRQLLIERVGFRSRIRGLRNAACTSCGAPLAGRGLP